MTQTENHAGTIAVEADIRRGEILAEMAVAGERRYGGDESSQSVLSKPTLAEMAAAGERATPSSQSVPGSLPTLADLNTTKRESSDAQKLAAQRRTRTYHPKWGSCGRFGHSPSRPSVNRELSAPRGL